jgi:hypothetical protein
MFDALARSLETECAPRPEPHYLVGNVMFDGDELDAIFLKPDAISVIEMKNYGGMIHFSENSDWFADETVVKGGVKGVSPLIISVDRVGGDGAECGVCREHHASSSPERCTT